MKSWTVLAVAAIGVAAGAVDSGAVDATSAEPMVSIAAAPETPRALYQGREILACPRVEIVRVCRADPGVVARNFPKTPSAAAELLASSDGGER